MEKVKLILTSREWIKNEKYGFSVKPFISLEDQVVLINIYLDEMFSVDGDERLKHLRAENAMIAAILSLNTNIELVDESGKNNYEIDQIYENIDLWHFVEKSIVNYPEVKREILKAAENERENIRLRATFGRAVDELYLNATNFISGIMKDLTPEKIAELTSSLKEAEASPILKAIVEKLPNKE